MDLPHRFSSIHKTIEIYKNQSTTNLFVVRICNVMTCFLLPTEKAQQKLCFSRIKLLHQRCAIVMNILLRSEYPDS